MVEFRSKMLIPYSHQNMLKLKSGFNLICISALHLQSIVEIPSDHLALKSTLRNIYLFGIHVVGNNDLFLTGYL